MAMFQAEISFLIALALFAAGLVVLHFGRQAGAGLLRGAAYLLLAGSAATAICTGYFSVRYHLQGEFDHAYPHHRAVSEMGMRGMGAEHRHMMGRGMMGPTPGAAPEAEPEKPAEHEEHHEVPQGEPGAN